MKERPLHELLNDVRESADIREQWEKTTSETLRYARKRAGLRQSDVATFAGLNQAYVSQIESGDRITYENARIVADAIEKASAEGGLDGNENEDTGKPDGKADAQKARQDKRPPGQPGARPVKQHAPRPKRGN